MCPNNGLEERLTGPSSCFDKIFTLLTCYTVLGSGTAFLHYYMAFWSKKDMKRCPFQKGIVIIET